MLPLKILILRFSEIAGNVQFSSYFCNFEVFKEDNQVRRKGALCPLWPPAPTPMFSTKDSKNNLDEVQRN